MKMKDMGRNNGNDEVWGRAKPVPIAPKEVSPFVQKHIGYRARFSTSKDSPFGKARKKIHRLRSFLINDAIKCFIQNHCQDAEATAAGCTIKTDTEDSDLPEIIVASLSEEELEWYNHMMEGMKADSSFEEQEFVGE